MSVAVGVNVCVSVAVAVGVTVAVLVDVGVAVPKKLREGGKSPGNMQPDRNPKMSIEIRNLFRRIMLSNGSQLIILEDSAKIPTLL